MTKHPKPEFRARACYSLGSIGHETALPYLVKALEDSVAVAGDIIIEKLADSNKYVRIKTIVSLQKLKYEIAIPYL
jgi:HEAT repeat protein